MRNPARIDRILAMLRRRWHREPDQRLGQLVVNLAREIEPATDLFQVEDRPLEQFLVDSGCEIETDAVWLAGAPCGGPDVCFTWNDWCQCTVETLSHNIIRAEEAEEALKSSASIAVDDAHWFYTRGLFTGICIGLFVAALAFLFAGTAHAAEPLAPTTTSTCTGWCAAYQVQRKASIHFEGIAAKRGVEITRLEGNLADRDQRIGDLTRALAASPPLPEECPAQPSAVMRALRGVVLVSGAVTGAALGGGSCALARCDPWPAVGVTASATILGATIATAILEIGGD